MRTSEAIDEIAGALALAQGAITNAEKDRVNPHLGNKYMTLTSVWDAIRKPLSDNGLSIVQVTEADDDGAVLLLTRLMHASGQYIEATYPVIGMENRGVNAAQAAGSALTYARRYSLTSLIGVVADEDDDAGAATGNRQQAKPQTQAKPAPAANKPAQPATNGNGTKPATRPDWHNVDDAVMWGMDQGAFKAVQHSQNAYNKLKAEAMASDNPPKNAKDMFERWHADVLLRLENAKGKTITDAELDNVPDAAAELPQF